MSTDHEIDSVSSSSSESLLTPPSTIQGSSTYSRQYNVTPSAEPRSINFARQEQINDNDKHLAAAVDGFNLQPSIHLESVSGQSSIPDVEHDFDHIHYNIRDEKLPDAPIYDKSLQATLAETMKHLDAMHTAMQRCPVVSDPSSRLASIAQQTQELAAYKYPKTRTIGFVGGSGAGKSSLINSLLDVKGLAKSSGDGGACTNIVTEYRSINTHLHTTNYHLEVVYMTSQDVAELLEELLSSYRAYYTDAFKEVKNPSEQDAIRTKAERSWRTLSSLFGDHPHFSEELLRESGPNALTSSITLLNGMVNEIQGHRPGGREAACWSSPAETILDLTNQLDVFIRDDNHDGTPTIWPFVRLIRIFAKSVVLRTGLVLADLPGLQDLNYARVRATEKYMRSCDEVFVVSTIYRVVTDAAVKEILWSCGNHRPVRIVCTCSENVKADEARRSSSAQDSARIWQLSTAVQKLSSSHASHIRQIKNTRDCEARNRLLEKDFEIREKLDQGHFDLQKYLVNLRNQNVKIALEKEYSDSVLNRDLKVFPVSNTYYSDHRDDELSVADKHLDLSGIPALRRFCQLIPAEAQFIAVAAFLEHQVPALVGSIRQWLLQGSDNLTVARAEKLQSVLKEAITVFENWKTIISTVRCSLKDDFRNRILENIAEHSRHWKRDAIGASQSWAGLHHQTYAALCRKNGVHYSEAAKRHYNWNDEIVTSMRQELDVVWDGRISESLIIFTNSVNNFKQDVDTQSNKLQDSLHLAPNALQNLMANMKPREQCIRDHMLDAQDDFRQKAQNIQRDGLCGHHSSYIVDLIRSTYLLCQAEYGGGSDRRRKDHMAQRLSGSNLFLELRSKIRKAQWELIDVTLDDLELKLKADFDNQILDFKNVVSTEGELTECQKFSEIANSIQKLIGPLDTVTNNSRSIIAALRMGSLSFDR